MIISTTAVVIAMAAALVVRFWDWIRDVLFQKIIRTCLEKLFGEKRASWFVEFTIWLDNKTCLAQRIAKLAWNRFRTTVLGIKSLYVRIDGQTAEKVTEVELVGDNGEIHKQTRSETVAYNEIPDEARETMTRNNSRYAMLDDFAIVQRKYAERCAKEGFGELTLEV